MSWLCYFYDLSLIISKSSRTHDLVLRQPLGKSLNQHESGASFYVAGLELCRTQKDPHASASHSPSLITSFCFPISISVTCTPLSPLYCSFLSHNGPSSHREQFLGGSEDCPVSALLMVRDTSRGRRVVGELWWWDLSSCLCLHLGL